MLIALIAVGAAVAAGCGGGNGEEPAPTGTERTADDETPTPPADESTPVDGEETPSTGGGELSYDELINLTITDLDEYWTSTVPTIYGIAYEPLAAIGPYYVSTGDVPQCGETAADPAEMVGNAFYCPPGDFIAWDEETLFPQLFSDYGDFAVALVIAHEWGHAIQARGGAEGPTILTELQADCFAGSWSAYVDSGLSNNLALSPGDLDEAIAGYLQFRDTPGTSIEDPSAHGSAFDRVNAFEEGYNTGAARCADYVTTPPVVIPLEFTSQEEIESGGDLPYADIAPLITLDLDEYWSIVFPELFGGEWTQLAAYGPYFVSEPDSLPPCGNEDVSVNEYAGNAFYCPADDYIAWDEEGLMTELYNSFGDFAVALVIAHEWGHAVQARGGITGPASIDLEQQADCFAGGWVASVILEQLGNLTLSPGDLDEAIAGFVVFRDTPGTPQDDPEAHGSAFQRIGAFQDGVINGAEACLPYAS
jgi:predicted metalloprotease